ncbi:MAG: anhydro-N-acetylmuramic acid kinase [Candidatus Eremiobacteraeota bacterium]|nr:anhydro-N-acetylmuramic acid kinase [Candidatus Eremiobacteraeota bacterium]
MIAIGMMSGTSLDGVDAALVDIRAAGTRYQVKLLDFSPSPYDAALRRDIEALFPPASVQPATIADLHRRIGIAYAEAAAKVPAETPIDYVAMHGQTVFHDGERAITLQLGSPYFVRDRLQTTVCYDFRSADCALNGHGAPLVPYADAALFVSSVEDRIAVNIGGIANITYIPRDAKPEEVLAFDTGPGNMLIDAFIAQRTNGAERYDADGAHAEEGTICAPLLGAMLDDGFFSRLPPKSAGREQFGAPFLAAHAAALERLSLEDGAATLAALTAEVLARDIKAVAPLGAHVFVGGGGTRNNALMTALRERLSSYDVDTTEALNLPAEARECVAFALLGYATLLGKPANLPRVTGAQRPAVLGSIVPYEIATLLEKMHAESAG